MNAIDRIKSRFEIKLPDRLGSEPLPASPPPCQCGHTQHWRAHHQTHWRCFRCTPPPARSLVAQWWPDEADTAKQAGELSTAPQSSPESPESRRVTSELNVTFCKPWCESCGGWRGIEQTFNDGTHTIHCMTCKAELPEVPREREKEQKSTVEGV